MNNKHAAPALNYRTPGTSSAEWRQQSLCQTPQHAEYEQLYSSASDRERERERERKKQTKTIYNKHRNTIDLQDYQAVTCV